MPPIQIAATARPSSAPALTRQSFEQAREPNAMAFASAVAALSARPHARSSCACARRRPRMGALETPVKEDVRTRLNRLLTLTPDVAPASESEGKRQRVDPGKEYKVLIFNDEANSKDYVARVLARVIPGLSPEAAWAIMQKAHRDGSAVVGVWVFEVSEGYCESLRNNGLRSDIQPV